jgi:hypothetical protein
VKTRVFLAIEKRSMSLSKHMMWSKHLLLQTKKNKTENKNNWRSKKNA